MGLNLEREREKQAKLKSRGDSKYWKPQDGPNVIRVLSFTHKVTKQDVEAKLYDKSEAGKTAGEWCYPFTVHYGLNPENRKAPVLSSPEIMALWKKLKDSKDEQDQKKAEIIRPSKKYAMNIIDLNATDKGVQIYLAAKSVREYIGDLVIDPDFGEAVLGAKGRDFKIKYDSKAPSIKDYYKIQIQDKDKCRAMNSKVIDKAFDLFDPKVNEGFAPLMDFDELDVPDEAPAREEDLEGVQAKRDDKPETGDIFDD